MAVYGFLITSVDTKSEKSKYQQQVGNLLETEVETAISFVGYELLKINRQKIESWLKTESRLDIHKRSINKMLFAGNYSNGGAEQQILNTVAGRWPSLAGDAYQSLIESDLGWAEIKDASGAIITLDPNTFLGIRNSTDSSFVNRANRAYFKKAEKLEHAFGLLLTRRIEADVMISRYRKFDNAIDASFYLSDGVPENTYKKISQIRKNHSNLLQKYFQLRTKAMGLEGNSINNLNIPYTGLTKTFPIAEAQRITLEVAGLFGKTYQDTMKTLFSKPYFHLPAMADKRTTFGIYQPVGKGNTYMIMNYQNRFNNARGYCGGLFLMQTYESIPKNRLPDTRNDPPIYSNAMIYLGNILFEDYMIKTATEKNEKRAYLIFALDRLWSNFFRWAIVGELEADIQTRIINKEPLTGKQISNLYLNILRETFGHHNNTAAVDEGFALDWMNNPNIFYNYDHLFWPPAIATACLLSERVQSGDATAIKAANKILGYGDIDLSYQLLKKVNIDLASNEPYQALIRRMNNLLLSLEETL